MEVKHCPECGAEYDVSAGVCIEHDQPVDLLDGEPPETFAAQDREEDDDLVLDRLVAAEVRAEAVASQLRILGWVVYGIGLAGAAVWIYQTWRSTAQYDDVFDFGADSFPSRLDFLLANVGTLLQATVAVGLGTAMRAGGAWLDLRVAHSVATEAE